MPGPLRVEAPLGRGTVERSPLPGRVPAAPAGAVVIPDQYGERAHRVAYAAAIALVAGIVVGQLWALTVALDAWLGGQDAVVGWILGFQVLSFAVALAIWFVAAGRSR